MEPASDAALPEAAVAALGDQVRTVLCLHFVDNPNSLDEEVVLDLRPSPEAECHYCEAISSMELDLISYKFQDENLVHTNLLYDEQADADGTLQYTFSIPVDVWFPARIAFVSEGRPEVRVLGTPEMTLLTPASQSGERGKPYVRRACRAHLCRSYFRQSGIAVWNVVLTGRAGRLDEHDLITLMHLYEGRSEQARLDDEIVFDVHGVGPVVGVEGLLDELWDKLVGPKFKVPRAYEGAPAMPRPFETDAARRPAQARYPRGATIQVVVGNRLGRTTLTQALRVVYGARRENHAQSVPVVSPRPRQGRPRTFSDELERWLDPKRPTDTGRQLIALAGIVNGIFDFAEIGDEEIMDTLDPTFSSADNFIKVHRRNLINITDYDRVLDGVGDVVGISPYFIVPHAVILHNEEIIDRVDDCLDTFMHPEKAEVAVRAVEERIRKEERTRRRLVSAADVRLLERLKAVALRETKRRYVPNLFNYATEKTLYDRAFAVRGSEEKRAYTLDRMVDLERQIDGAHEARRRRDDAYVQLLLLALTLMQVVDLFVNRTYPLVVNVAIGVGALVALLVGRYYLFSRVR